MELNKPNTPEIPSPISEYIRKNFREDFINDVKLVKDDHGVGFYFVDITHETKTYHLKFSETGTLVQNEIESVVVPDDESELGTVD